MRAIFHPFSNVKKGEILTIEDERARHLQVVRVKPNEEIKVMNGLGKSLIANTISIAKNKVELDVKEIQQEPCFHQISLALALPKKDAFEDILKITVELGVKEIYPLFSTYSQYEFSHSDRIDRILESALIQSNNPFFPIIHPQIELKDFLNSHGHQIVFFNSKPSSASKSLVVDTQTILVGPEGGFSEEEINLVRMRKDLVEIHLPTPILRAPTAVASSIAYLLAKG